MARLEDLQAGAYFRGLAATGTATIVHIGWFGDQAAKVTYEDTAGAVRNRLLYRNEEPTLESQRSAGPGRSTEMVRT